ncbi:MAG: FtsX-like permease family protein [Chloroflexota bacterium]
MLLSLAARDLRHRALSYAAYFLSSTFAVWLFCVYATLLAHPQLRAKVVGWQLRVPLQAALWIVGVFAVLFVGFAHSTFLRLKQKELGVLSLLGMLPGQVARVVFAENMLIGAGALVTGISLSAVLAKLLFLAAGRAFGTASPLAYHFAPSAVLLTVALFGSTFAGVSIHAYVRIVRTPLAVLIRDAAAPKRPPRASLVLTAICLAALGGAYWLALTATSANFERRFLTVAGLLLVGTYLLFSQLSVGILSLLRWRRGLYYHRSNLLTLAQLGYRVRDNVRSLFMVSILTLFVLFAVSTYYSAGMSLERYTLEQMPQSLLVVAKPAAIDADAITSVLARHELSVGREAHMRLLVSPVDLPDGSMRYSGMTIAAVSEVNVFAAAAGIPPLSLDQGQALVAKSSGGDPFLGRAEQIVLSRAGGTSETLDYVGMRNVRILNESNLTYEMIVIPDETFERIYAAADDALRVAVHGYSLSDWKASGPAVTELRQMLGIDFGPQAKPPVQASPTPGDSAEEHEMQIRPAVAAAISSYDRGRQDASTMLFLTILLGMLFFLAAGNMLYFRLFNELYSDRTNYQALSKLGVGREELRHIISVQTAVLFFAPLAVAGIHAAVAMTVVAKLVVGFSLLRPTLAVLLGYATLQGVYFLITRQTYLGMVLRSEQ